SPRPHRRTDRTLGHRQYLPLWRLSAYPARRPTCRRAANDRQTRSHIMTDLEVSASQQQGAQTLTVAEPGPPDMQTWTEDTDLEVVGTRNPRLEAFEKLTGRALYSSDVRLQHRTYARDLRSPYPPP